MFCITIMCYLRISRVTCLQNRNILIQNHIRNRSDLSHPTFHTVAKFHDTFTCIVQFCSVTATTSAYLTFRFNIAPKLTRNINFNIAKEKSNTVLLKLLCEHLTEENFKTTLKAGAISPRGIWTVCLQTRRRGRTCRPSGRVWSTGPPLGGGAHPECRPFHTP